jgi:predicted alpha/beta superfamily hydrolase
MASQYPESTIFHSEVRRITSAHTRQTHPVDVWLPPSYAASARRYPTVYLLDGNLLFGAAASLALPLIWGGELPELIIVGIGYADLQSYDTWGELRSRSFDTEADQFRAFIAAELIPMVDAEYRTDPGDRALAGHSGGGFFSLSTLFHQPTMFQRYAIGSPFDEKLKAYEAAYAAQHARLPAKVVVVVGSLEENEVAGVWWMETVVRARGYVGLDLTTLVMEGESHVSVMGRWLIDGWKRMYAAC